MRRRISFSLVRPRYITPLALLLPWAVSRNHAVYHVAESVVSFGPGQTRLARAWLADSRLLLIEDPDDSWWLGYGLKSMLPTVAALSLGRKRRFVINGSETDGHRVDRRLVIVANPHPPRRTTVEVGTPVVRRGLLA
jgi:hypothetical protein